MESRFKARSSTRRAGPLATRRCGWSKKILSSAWRLKRTLQVASHLQPSRQAAIYSARKSHGTVVLAPPQGDRKSIDLILEGPGDIQSDPKPPSPSPTQEMEFSDKPN